MGKVRIYGNSSGYYDLQPPAVAGSTTLNLEQIPRKDTANTFTGDQTITGALTVGDGSGNESLTLYSGTADFGTLYFADGTGGADTYRGYAQYNHTSNYLRFGTDATEQMRIDALGRVTKPNQPGFAARGAGGGISATNRAVYTLNSGGAYNVGGHYDFSNSRFTVPVSGRYLFTYSWYTNANNQGQVRFAVNGAYTGAVGPLSRVNFTGTNYSNRSNSAILNLTAADYVELYVDLGSAYFDNDCWFTGILLG